MGTVFKTRHRLMDRTVALKVMNPWLLTDPTAVGRFEREVKAAAQLAHPHIVTAYDAEQIGGLHFLAMEYVEVISRSAAGTWTTARKPDGIPRRLRDQATAPPVPFGTGTSR